MMLPNTPEDIVAKLRMFRSRYPRHSLVLVEGQSDEALWTEYKADRCSLIPAGNKEKAVKALDLANSKTKLQGVAALVDPDYWLVEQSGMLEIENLLFDDSPDMESMIINSPALEKVMRHTFLNIDTDEIHEFTYTLRDESFRLAIEFGYFRLLDARHREFNLMLRRVADKFPKFVNEETLEFRIDDVAAALLEETSVLKVSELLSRVEALKAQNLQSMILCRGKDAIALMAFLLPLHYRRRYKNDISQKARKQTTGNELARALRMAFEYAHFLMTQLYGRIRAWEGSNTPYKILA